MARAPLLDLRWRLLLAGLMTMFVGCAQDEGSALDLGGSAGTSDEVALALTGVDWGLQWRGVEPEEQGWSVTNDLGITFAVSGGWLLDYSVTLVRCSDAVANAGGGWLSLLGIGTAHAGHETYDDPSEVEAQWGEQLRTLESGTLGERTFDSDEYCGVHWQYRPPGVSKLTQLQCGACIARLRARTSSSGLSRRLTCFHPRALAVEHLQGLTSAA